LAFIATVIILKRFIAWAFAFPQLLIQQFSIWANDSCAVVVSRIVNCTIRATHAFATSFVKIVWRSASNTLVIWEVRLFCRAKTKSFIIIPYCAIDAIAFAGGSIVLTVG
jgi:hypothetical protein